MSLPSAHSRLAAAVAAAVFAGLLPAQFPPSTVPAPLPGIPASPPPVAHPALAGQPLIGDNGTRARAAEPAPDPAPGRPAPPRRDPATAGVKLEGKDLAKAVARVKALQWRESLAEARAQAAAHGKPILWLQALGDIDGFA